MNVMQKLKKEHFLLVFIISKENMHLDSKAPFDVI